MGESSQFLSGFVDEYGLSLGVSRMSIPLCAIFLTASKSKSESFSVQDVTANGVDTSSAAMTVLGHVLNPRKPAA